MEPDLTPDTDSAPELWQAGVLLRGLGYAPTVRIERGQPPEPDVVAWLHSDGDPVGIEVTQIHPLGSDRRRIEGEGETIVRLAQSEYERAGHPSVIVGVMWSDHFRPNKHFRWKAVEALVSAVAANVPEIGTRVDVEFDGSPGSMLPEGVAAVSITRVTDVDGYWHTPRAVFVPDIERAHIDEALRRKNPKRANYQSAYREAWLLLVASGAGPSTWGRLVPDALEAPFTSTFDRIFLINRLQLSFLELKAAPDGHRAIQALGNC